MRTLLNMMNESDPWGGVSVHLHQIDLTNRIEKAEPGSAVGSDERLKKVWSLTQFYSVDFSKSREGVKKCVFNKRTIKVCVSCC